MAAIHVAGVRGDPCGAVHWTVCVYQLLNRKMHGETLKLFSLFQRTTINYPFVFNNNSGISAKF